MKLFVFVAINFVLLMNAAGTVPAAPDLTAYKDELYLELWYHDHGNMITRLNV